jgi:hypothetical protein
VRHESEDPLISPLPASRKERGDALAAEMPEIAEVQALLAALAANEPGTADLRR